MINLKEKVSQATEKDKMLKLRLHFARVEVDKRYKVTSSGAQTCSVANIYTQVCVIFDATSCIDIYCARSFLCQVCWLS